MADDRTMRDSQLPIWVESMVFRQPGPLRRLIRAILSLGARGPSAVPGYDERQPPAAGAGVPARPKRPDPSLLATAEVDLTLDPD